MMNKTYSELLTIPTFEERYRYLKIGGSVGIETFGSNRYLNQLFYHTSDWRRFRREIILRDNGCDLAIQDRPILDRVYIHHINPISVEDVLERNIDKILNEENVVCVSFGTHQAIHYGDESLLWLDIPERKPNDTCPWRESI